LTGGGTLYISIPYVRSDFKGNWSAFTGWMDISGSNFRCGNSAGYPKARLHFNSGASLQNRVSGTPTIPIGELSGDAGSAIVAPGGNDGIDAIWRVGGLNSSATFDGTIANGVGLIKEGSGSWTLAGNNTYTRGTTVNGGTLLVNNTAGSGTGSGAVTVASGGALGGSGSIAGAVTVAAGGKLVPGGTLTVSNHLTLSGTSISQFEFGTVNDRVVVAGNLTLAGLLNITNSGDFFSSTNILFSYSGTLSGAGLTLGAVLPYFSYTISTNTPGVVRLTALSTVPAPLAPATLAATASNAVVFLHWSPSANTLSYHVKRSSVSGDPYTDIAVGVTGTNYADLTVANGYAYYYVVSASNGSGQSGTSPEAGAAPPGTVPDAPTGLSAVAGNQLVALNWIASTFATSYTVKRSTTNGGPYTNVVTDLTAPGYYDTGLTSGRAYYYVVSGVNINGESAISAQASATPFLIPAAYWTNRITGSAQSWNLNGNWTNAAAFPNGVSAVAVMNADITATQTNNLSQDVTLGALSIGDANSSSAYNLAASGGSLIFDKNGIPASLAQLSTSKGDTISAPIVLNDALVISNLSANTLALAGDISGATNGIRVNGNVNLSGANTFTGGLTIGPGSRVYPGSIAANSGAWGTGPITLQGGTVQFNGYGGSFGTGWGGCTNTINVPAGQTGTLLLPPRWGYSAPFTSPLVGGGTLNVTVDYIRDYFNGDWSAFTGQINIYTRSGSGDFRINNPNGYAGAAIYLAGSARFGCIYNSTQTIELGELAGDAGTLFGTCDSPAGTQTWRVGGRHTSATYAGTVTDGAHAANIVKLGAGTWTLTGSNTYSGTTTISGGILQIGAGGTSGSLASATIVNNATLAFNRADDLTYAGNISGTGSLTKLGEGALTLTGANTYSGLMRVSGGTLVLTDGGLAVNTSGYALNSGAMLDGRSLTGGLALISGQTLTGNGSILGSVAVGDGAILSPGDSMGVLTFSGMLSFA
jgi:autotransporter-associated beta strand protein